MTPTNFSTFFKFRMLIAWFPILVLPVLGEQTGVKPEEQDEGNQTAWTQDSLSSFLDQTADPGASLDWDSPTEIEDFLEDELPPGVVFSGSSYQLPSLEYLPDDWTEGQHWREKRQAVDLDDLLDPLDPKGIEPPNSWNDKRTRFHSWGGKRTSESALGYIEPHPEETKKSNPLIFLTFAHDLTPINKGIKMRPGFSSWGGKRTPPKPGFHSWGGKRASTSDSWGGKRGTPFHSWGGKRATPFHSWGGKRATPFHSWGGKRDTPFHSWGGKRATPFHSWGGKRATPFHSWGGKRGTQFHSWGGKRDSTPNSWEGKRGTPFHSWGGKRATPFHSWGGKRATSGQTASVEGGKRGQGFHSWGGKRNGGLNNELENSAGSFLDTHEPNTEVRTLNEPILLSKRETLKVSGFSEAPSVKNNEIKHNLRKRDIDFREDFEGGFDSTPNERVLVLPSRGVVESLYRDFEERKKKDAALKSQLGERIKYFLSYLLSPGPSHREPEAKKSPIFHKMLHRAAVNSQDNSQFNQVRRGVGFHSWGGKRDGNSSERDDEK